MTGRGSERGDVIWTLEMLWCSANDFIWGTELPAQLLEEPSSGRFTYFALFIFQTRDFCSIKAGPNVFIPQEQVSMR